MAKSEERSRPPGPDEDLFRKSYDLIVRAYTTHMPSGSAVNPGPSLLPEPFEACWAAECHRQYWKPRTLKLVLLAESHVYTDADDLLSKVRNEKLPDAARGAPEQFVRLIYCLGYGDSSLLTRQPTQANGKDTPFWDLFAEAAGLPSRPALTARSKAKILMAMMERGVWLADASIHACMNPRFSGRKKDRDKRRNIEFFPDLYQDVLKASWAYVGAQIRTASVVWVVGKYMLPFLPKDPLLDSSRWIYQPGIRMTKGMAAVQSKQMQILRETFRSLMPTSATWPEAQA